MFMYRLVVESGRGKTIYSYSDFKQVFDKIQVAKTLRDDIKGFWITRKRLNSTEKETK